MDSSTDSEADTSLAAFSTHREKTDPAPSDARLNPRSPLGERPLRKVGPCGMVAMQTDGCVAGPVCNLTPRPPLLALSTIPADMPTPPAPDAPPPTGNEGDVQKYIAGYSVHFYKCRFLFSELEFLGVMV